MKKQKKKIITISILVGILIYGIVQAQEPVESPVKQNRQYTSNSYTAQVAAILSKYNPSSLTAADAKAINDAFRSAGIRRGPEQKQAIEAAGFDPRKISSLDPPPEKKDRKGQCYRKQSMQ